MPGVKFSTSTSACDASAATRSAIRRVVGIEHGAALPAVPHLRAACTRRIAARRLDLGDLRAVFGEQHARDRPRDPHGQVEHDHTVEHTSHEGTAVR